jgi:putative acetyltransferase
MSINGFRKTRSITIERAVEATPQMHDLIGKLNDVLGAAWKAHQRHGLWIEQLFQPNVRFFLARLDGLAVGCGGVAVFDGYAEVKRMYTRPAARGRGVGKALLYRIEDEARRANKSLLRLETGTDQQEAIGLYERMGVSATRSVRPVYGNASLQHRDEPLFREDPSVVSRRVLKAALPLPGDSQLGTHRRGETPLVAAHERPNRLIA